MKTCKFRPHDYGKLGIMRGNRYGVTPEHNWSERRSSYDPLPNKRWLSGVFMKLHYLGSHSPEPIKRKWRAAERRFYLKHFGAPGKSSMRYANTWTCHSWI